MQCKARQRPCSFYKDGSLESDQQEKHNENSYDNMDGFFDLNSSLTAKNSDDHILFADTSSVNHNKLKRRGPLMESRISNTLGALGENLRKMSSADSSRLAEKLLNTTDSYGSFITWMPEPSLPSRYSGSIEMPSREIQMTLIDQFFSERYECIAFIPRHHFYQQIKNKGLLITPLLLNIIYAHAARFVDIPDCPKTEVFYQRARRLIDDFLDVPRVSTVAALCLLSLYESSPSIYRPGSLQCRQWQYSGMACRMALELGLYDDTNVHSGLSSVDIELRRRVFWGCYDLDKFQSGGWERPWMIFGCYVKTALPSALPEESEDDRAIVSILVKRIQFMQIVENDLTLLSAHRSFQTGNMDSFLGVKREEIMSDITEHHGKLQQWLRSLPPDMQWTPISSVSVKEVLDLHVPRPCLAHIHLYYNIATLSVLCNVPINSLVQFQTRVTATCITQLVYCMCQTPSYIVKFDFLVHGLISAVKIHLQYLNDVDINLAQQAWLLFDRSIWCMQLISNYAVIPNCTKFLQQVQNIYGLHIPASNSQNNNSGDDCSIHSSNNDNSSYISNENGTSNDTIPSQKRFHNETPKQPDLIQKRNTMSLNQIPSNASLPLPPPPVQFNEHINTSPYLNWSSNLDNRQANTSSSMLRMSNDNNEANNNRNVLYLDQQYRMHDRNKGHYEHAQRTNSPPIWDNSHQQLDYTIDNRGSTHPANNNSYNSGNIIVPSQLLVEDSTYSRPSSTPSSPSPLPPLPTAPLLPLPNSPSTPINTRFASDSTLLWQDPVPSPNTPVPNENQLPVRKGLGAIYLSSRQHYEKMIKRPE
ncbi:fungal-specific transcription factor domain-containing protein [Blakeslea trispora]|nr:fungal-specific transcription factor domain-containing protein [Blakeslea trispora]